MGWYGTGQPGQGPPGGGSGAPGDGGSSVAGWPLSSPGAAARGHPATAGRPYQLFSPGYFPLATFLLLSLLATLVINLLLRLKVGRRTGGRYQWWSGLPPEVAGPLF